MWKCKLSCLRHLLTTSLGILRSTFEPFQYALWPWNCRRWGLVSTTTIRWLLNLVLHFEISWLLLKAGFWALHRWFKLVLLVSNLVISPEFVYISAPHHCSGNFPCQIKFWLWLDSYGHIQIDSVWVLSVLAGWVSHLGNSSVMCYYRGSTWCLNPSAYALPLTADTHFGKYWIFCWVWDALSTTLELTFFVC